MRFIHEGQDLRIGWRYDNKYEPQETECFIEDDKKEVIHSVTIIKYFRDPQLGGEGQVKDGQMLKVRKANDKVRKLALEKLLNSFYPGPQYKTFRTIVWKAYRSRGHKEKTMDPVNQ